MTHSLEQLFICIFIELLFTITSHSGDHSYESVAIAVKLCDIPNRMCLHISDKKLCAFIVFTSGAKGPAQHVLQAKGTTRTHISFVYVAGPGEQTGNYIYFHFKQQDRVKLHADRSRLYQKAVLFRTFCVLLWSFLHYFPQCPGFMKDLFAL